MEMKVNLGSDSYPIYIENGLLTQAGEYLSKLYSGKKIMIVSDDQVFPLYGNTLIQSLQNHYECHHLVLPHGEPTKAFETLPTIYRALLKAKLSRSDLLIALGGGVIGDLSGFAAASYLRGIPFVQIPTSLLAQVDSSVGGKVAVDLPEGKNLVGAFYHPKMVLIDPTVLDTLPEHFVRDGMGEVIKYGCIFDQALFQQLASKKSFEELKPELSQVIYRCVDLKRQVVEEDPTDKGQRMLLNFGHTLAHTIEQYHRYQRESHGEAVAIGMYQITKLAEEQNLTHAGTADQIQQTLQNYGLPCSCGITLNKLTEAITLDKKNLNNKLNIILLKQIGESYIHPTTSAFFQKNIQI